MNAATVREVLILTEGYLDDGYGAADLAERLPRAKDALSALVAERDRLHAALERASTELGELTKPPWIEGMTPLIAEVRDFVREALAGSGGDTTNGR